MAQTLDAFLVDQTPLTGVELLPDGRLINVVIGDGALYGVVTGPIPDGAKLSHHVATYSVPIIGTLDGLTFDATQYEMLG